MTAFNHYETEIKIPLYNRVLVIAEVGINHNGDMEIAKALMDMAKEAGCDAVKFQKRTIDIVYTPKLLDEHRDSPWGTTQRAQKMGLEFSKEQYDKIDAYARELGIDWFASAWDIPSQEFLRQFNCKYNKVASAMLTNLPFLQEVAKEKRTTFISTGMSMDDDVAAAVDVFRRNDCPFVLMHTVSTYPSKESDLNLRCMMSLRDIYGCDIGYSGHETSVSPSVVAAAMGACVIERHITLDRSMYGSDQAASLEMPGLKQMVAMIRKIPVVRGDGVRRISEGEQAVADKLRYWNVKNVSVE